MFSRNFILIFYFLFISTSVFSQNRHYYDNLKNSKQKDIKYSKNLLKTLQHDNKSLTNSLLVLESQIRKQKEIVNIISKEQKLLNENLNYNNNVITELQTQLKLHKHEYAKLIKFSWFNINLQQRMIYVLSASDFNSAYKRILYLKQLSDYRKLKSLKIQQSITKLDSVVSHLENIKIEKNNLSKERKSTLDSLALRKKVLDNLLSSNKNNIANIKKEMRFNQSRRDVVKDKLNRAFVQHTVAKREVNTKQDIKNKSDEYSNLTKKFTNRKRRHIWPLSKCVILHKFGDYRHPKFSDVVIKNDGIELGSDAGVSVHAIYKGVIRNILNIPGEGNSIIIKHGEFYTIYSNLWNLDVKLGDKVTTGQVIAFTKSNVKMSKINFQIWHKKTKLNPIAWLRRR